MDIFKTKRASKEHLVNLTKELIRFPSNISEPRKVFELADFIKSYFSGDGLHISEYVFNGLPSLVVTTEETKHPHIMLSGHMDVVPSSYVYSAKVEGDLLYGSGAMDMKGGVACMMAVMKYFAKMKNRPSLGIMITGDEEIGGDSTKMLLNEEGYGADFCIVNEGRSKYEIVNREKGLFVVSISLKANPIHSAYPWKGRNVTEELMKLCMNVKTHFPKVREGWIPSVSVTSLRVGREQEYNTIPGEAEAVLFFRLTGKRWNKEKILDLLKRLAPLAEIREQVYGDAFHVDFEEERIMLLRKVARGVTGKRVGFGSNHGASDARYFIEKGIKTVVLGPVGKHHHSPEEFVSIESLVTHFMVLKKFIEVERKGYTKTAKQVIEG